MIYPQPIENAISKIESLFSEDSLPNWEDNYIISRRSLALLLLQKDPNLWQLLQQDQTRSQEVEIILTTTQNQLGESLCSAIAQTRHQQARNLEKVVLTEPDQEKTLFTEKLHQITVNPLTGFPILLIILYYGVYKFVGEFGAGTLVDLIETFFEEQINPVVNQVTALIFPWQPLQDLIANDYGIITLGIRYATAIVLPVVATFFLMFSLL